jgi:hypothetical protein
VWRRLRVPQRRRQAVSFVTRLGARGCTVDGFEEVIDGKVRQHALGHCRRFCRDHRQSVSLRAKLVKGVSNPGKQLILYETDLIEALAICRDCPIASIVVRVRQQPLKDHAQRRADERPQLIVGNRRHLELSERIVEGRDDSWR